MHSVSLGITPETIFGIDCWIHAPSEKVAYLNHWGKVVAAHVPELLVQTAPVAPALELEAHGRIFQN